MDEPICKAVTETPPIFYCLDNCNRLLADLLSLMLSSQLFFFPPNSNHSYTFKTQIWLCPIWCSVAQLCLTLCSPMDCNPPDSSADGIFQAKGLEEVAISHSICLNYPCAKSADFCHLIGLTKIPTTSCTVLYNPAPSYHADFTSYHPALVSVCNAPWAPVS